LLPIGGKASFPADASRADLVSCYRISAHLRPCTAGVAKLQINDLRNRPCPDRDRQSDVNFSFRENERLPGGNCGYPASQPLQTSLVCEL
jgi:hypothetical protein